jgi:uncharacterized protein (DUF2164 family)
MSFTTAEKLRDVSKYISARAEDDGEVVKLTAAAMLDLCTEEMINYYLSNGVDPEYIRTWVQYIHDCAEKVCEYTQEQIDKLSEEKTDE